MSYHLSYPRRRALAWKMKGYVKSPLSLFLYLMVLCAALITFSILFFLIAYIFVKGIPHITPALFAWEYTTENVSLTPALVNTLIIMLLALVIAAPLGIASAIYLVEYARRDNKLVGVVGLTAETLAGIPSIVYGLFGLLFFVTTLGWGFSLMAGAFTLAIMILPLIMRSTEEALKAVPGAYREGSFALGAGKLRTVLRIVLPAAMPGILAGIILAIGRVVGETAALIYTAGTVADLPENLLSSGRSLAVHMYALSSEGLYINQAYATAAVLVFLVLLVNGLSSLVAKKLMKG